MPPSFQVALQHYQSGRLADAESICRQILAIEPRHADALHMLGFIAYQAGRNEIAVQMILQATSVAPTVPIYFFNLALAYRQAGNQGEAIAAFQQVLRRDEVPLAE